MVAVWFWSGEYLRTVFCQRQTESQILAKIGDDMHLRVNLTIKYTKLGLFLHC